ncbi:hypothetical protein OPV22_018332 [Ensete ventricosum]|uniref:EGF-like domain-containing protein n=1 Tax=Ensete ventricosum TaxID=4639 RepID=A0AAV8R319_ENSVE|nr:hypothetical protein OPV22_018332 [Ensete ventricosum]
MECRAKLLLVLMALQSITTLRRHTATADDTLSPLFGHGLDDICSKNLCGKGTCESAPLHAFGFVCNCDPGWTQFHIGDHLRFLPCIIPKCSINLPCQNESMAQASSPSPTPHPDELISLLDPCLYSFCGDGTCVKTSTFGHRCDCKEGFSNLLNKSSLPCYRDCSVDNSCNKGAVGPSPSPSPYPFVISLWDPCKFSYCGDGTCVKTSTFGHRCDCNEGSKNLLNDNSFACYKDCSIGADCANLGITLPHPHLPNIFKSSGGVVPNTLLWTVVPVIAVAMAHAT